MTPEEQLKEAAAKFICSIEESHKRLKQTNSIFGSRSFADSNIKEVKLVEEKFENLIKLLKNKNYDFEFDYKYGQIYCTIKLKYHILIQAESFNGNFENDVKFCFYRKSNGKSIPMDDLFKLIPDLVFIIDEIGDW